MTNVILVREARSGVQDESDMIHCIMEEDNETVCERFKSKELRTIRNLGVFYGHSNICTKCSEEISNVLTSSSS